MTDIGTGSYTIIAPTAAEMLGVPLNAVSVGLGDSRFPVSSGSGGQWGAAGSTAGVYATCKGNSHMIMQDENNIQIADLVLKWIDENANQAAE